MGTADEIIHLLAAKATLFTQEASNMSSHFDEATTQAYQGAEATHSPFNSPMRSPPCHPYLYENQRDAFSIIKRGKNMDDGKDAILVQIPKAIPRKMGLIGAKSGQTRNASVGSGCNASSQRDDIHSEGLSDTNDENANELASPEIRKKSYSQMLADVSGPGNSTTPVSTTNLNNGMNMWNACNAGAAPTPIMSAPNQVSLIRTFGNEDLLNDRRPDQDESELKRLKRQQSNRESARRSKMRKQAECEELQARVEKIRDENVTLTDEIKSLAKQCEELNSENNDIMEELNQNYRCGSVSDLQVNNLVSRSANGEENSHEQYPSRESQVNLGPLQAANFWASDTR